MSTMLYRICKIIFSTQSPDKLLLGRWGYHWELKKIHQKYYE